MAKKIPLWQKDEFYEEFKEPFASIAKKVNWGNSGDDLEDTEQSIWVHFYEIWEWSDKKQTSPGAMYWSRAIILTHAQKWVASYAKQEMLDYENFRTTYVYTPAAVDQFLREAVWSGAADCPDVDARADIGLAFRQLNKNRQRVIFRVYALKEELEHSSGDRRTKDRALREIADVLNHNLPTITQGSGPYSLEDMEGRRRSNRPGPRSLDRFDY